MTFRRFAIRCLPLAIALAVVSFAGEAAAQTIALPQEASLPRLDKNGQIIQKRPLTLSPEAVSLQDCLDDQSIRFTLLMTGFEANAGIEAWASTSGADCKQQLARNPGAAGQTCWKILDTQIPLQQTTDVDIPVRRIMSGVPPFSPGKPDATIAVCGAVDQQAITVQFLYFPPLDKSTASQSKTVPITVDTVGPKPPSGLTALPGNTRIQVSWVNISGGTGDAAATGGLTELTGVNVYCDPASGGGSPTTTTTQNPPICRQVTVEDQSEAGAAGDAGDAGNGAVRTVEVCEDGGTSTTTNEGAGGDCTSPNYEALDGGLLFPTTEFDSKFLCGSITGNSGTTVVATELQGQPLMNGTRYAVVVAATDKFGNVGTLSNPICQTPNLTTDFWDQYKNAGGKAGGCDAGGSASLGGLGALALIGSAAALARLGRRMQRNEKRSRR